MNGPRSITLCLLLTFIGAEAQETSKLASPAISASFGAIPAPLHLPKPVPTNAVNDAFQSIRLVRAHAKEWNIDPSQIGIMGFSAGAELAAPGALFFDDFERKNSDDSFAGISARPDFVVLVYPGPTPFARG